MPTNKVTLEEAAGLLKAADDILILTHRNPDGDTLGSAFALCDMLKRLGKRVAVSPSGKIPNRYSYITDKHLTVEANADKSFIVTTDIAAVSLTDDEHKSLCECADLCIDHHAFNEGYAKQSFVDPSAAACCEIIYSLLPLLGLSLDRYTAECIYTGISTDTGCFKYRNTTARTHIIAAELMSTGFDLSELNTILFERKSRSRLALEQLALEGIRFHLGGKAAVITISQKMLRQAGADENDIEGITPLPRMIDGVEAGVTMRELPSGFCKVSLRTNHIDASEICQKFGGGGHKGAAGFECSGSFSDIENLLLSELQRSIEIEDAKA